MSVETEDRALIFSRIELNLKDPFNIWPSSQQHALRVHNEVEEHEAHGATLSIMGEVKRGHAAKGVNPKGFLLPYPGHGAETFHVRTWALTAKSKSPINVSVTCRNRRGS